MFFRIEYNIIFIKCIDVVVSIIMLIVVSCSNHVIVWDGHCRENRIVCIISISGRVSLGLQNVLQVGTLKV